MYKVGAGTEALEGEPDNRKEREKKQNYKDYANPRPVVPQNFRAKTPTGSILQHLTKFYPPLRSTGVGQEREWLR